MTFRSRISSVASWVALVAVATLLGLGLLALVLRVSALDSALLESQADRRALHSELDKQEAASQTLADQVERLGGKPVVEPGNPSPDQRGPAPTAQEIRAAVGEFCADQRCVGRPTQAQVTAALVSYCTGGRCVGKPGADGQDSTVPGPAGQTGQQGPGPTAEQIAQAVADYCADGRCRGEKGDTGNTGATGDPGPAGRSVESVTCDQGLGTFTFTFSDGTSQTVQCTPSAEPEN